MKKTYKAVALPAHETWDYDYEALWNAAFGENGDANDKTISEVAQMLFDCDDAWMSWENEFLDAREPGNGHHRFKIYPTLVDNIPVSFEVEEEFLK